MKQPSTCAILTLPYPISFPIFKTYDQHDRNHSIRYHGIIGGRSYFNTEKYFIPEGTGFTGFEFNLVNSTKLAGNSSGSGVTGPDGKQVEVKQYSSGP